VVDRRLAGTLVALATLAVLGGVMLPLRDELSVATAALVLVVPVLAGVVVGGFVAGLVAVAAGFVVYDVAFIPPYGTLSVGAGQNWVALAVYVVAMLLVSRVVANLDTARKRAEDREEDSRRLFELSELLVTDQPLDRLLPAVVSALRGAFGFAGVTLLLPRAGSLEVVASAGEALEAATVADLAGGSPGAVALESGRPGRGATRLVALSTGGTHVGLLAVIGGRRDRPDRAALDTFANQLAQAVERAGLRDRALRAGLLEEVDRLRRSLVGAVSHDLRTPLATIKVAASTLREQPATLGPGDAAELAALVDEQADRLDRLVANLLDMTRIQSGALVVRPEPLGLVEVVEAALAGLGAAIGRERVALDGLEQLPAVRADRVLLTQVFANLLENATHHAPEDTRISVGGARRADGQVEVWVSDEGPGVPAEDREGIFVMFTRRAAGGRAGLGLAIVKAFLAAHGQDVSVGDAPGGGARFSFALPVAEATALQPGGVAALQPGGATALPPGEAAALRLSRS